MRLPEESTVLWFSRRLEDRRLAEQMLTIVNYLLTAKGLLLKAGKVVDVTLIEAPALTKNKDRACDLYMHSSKKGKQ